MDKDAGLKGGMEISRYLINSFEQKAETYLLALGEKTFKGGAIHL